MKSRKAIIGENNRLLLFGIVSKLAIPGHIQ